MSTIYFDQIIHFVELCHTSTFKRFPPPPLENFVISIRYDHTIIAAARSLSFSYCPFILSLILCMMRLMPVNKQSPKFKVIFIIAIQILFSKNIVSIAWCLGVFWSRCHFLLLSIILCKNNACFNLIFFISSQSK